MPTINKTFFGLGLLKYTRETTTGNRKEYVNICKKSFSMIWVFPKYRKAFHNLIISGGQPFQLVLFPDAHFAGNYNLPFHTLSFWGFSINSCIKEDLNATLLNRYNLVVFSYLFVKCSTVEGFVEKHEVNFLFKWSNYTPIL